MSEGCCFMFDVLFPISNGLKEITSFIQANQNRETPGVAFISTIPHKGGVLIDPLPLTRLEKNWGADKFPLQSGKYSAGRRKCLTPPSSEWTLHRAMPIPFTSRTEWITCTFRSIPGSSIAEIKSHLSKVTKWEAPESQIEGWRNFVPLNWWIDRGLVEQYEGDHTIRMGLPSHSELSHCKP